MYLFRFDEKEMVSEIRPRSMTLPGRKESNQSNSESPKKASIDSNSVPRTLMRSGSIGKQLLNLCQKKRNKSHVFVAFDKQFSLDFKNESKVLVLYTGGTIGRESHIFLKHFHQSCLVLNYILFFSGMVRNSAGVLVLQPNAMESRIRKIVTMHDEDYSRVGKTNYDRKLSPR